MKHSYNLSSSISSYIGTLLTEVKTQICNLNKRSSYIDAFNGDFQLYYDLAVVTQWRCVELLKNPVQEKIV